MQLPKKVLRNFSRAGGNPKDLNKPKRRKFLTRSVELVNEEDSGNIKEGPLRAWCIGYEKDGKTKYQTVHADAAGFAERKIKREHDVRDKAIKSTKEGKCKGHA
jgi:hypothetical protein